jgi:hypothetical protein
MVAQLLVKQLVKDTVFMVKTHWRKLRCLTFLNTCFLMCETVMIVVLIPKGGWKEYNDCQVLYEVPGLWLSRNEQWFLYPCWGVQGWDYSTLSNLPGKYHTELGHLLPSLSGIAAEQQGPCLAFPQFLEDTRISCCQAGTSCDLRAGTGSCFSLWSVGLVPKQVLDRGFQTRNIGRTKRGQAPARIRWPRIEGQWFRKRIWVGTFLTTLPTGLPCNALSVLLKSHF